MVRKSAADRREDLVEAAIRVMSREGVDRATTRAIVAEASASLSTFHYCFDSREQLLVIAAKRLADRMTGEVRTALSDESDLRARIRMSLDAFWRRVEDDPDRELVGYEIAQYAMRTDGLQPLARELFRHYSDAFENFLTESARVCAIEWTLPVPVLARFLNSTLDGLSMCWLVDRDTERTLCVLDALVDYLVSCSHPAR